MGKLFRVGDYILLGAALAGDTLNEIKNFGDVMPWIMEMRYGYVPNYYKKSNYLSAVSQHISTGDIQRITDKKGNVYLELTTAGQKKVNRKFPIFSVMQSKWDGYFMQVIFDIPEKEKKSRDKIRHKLESLGFGMLQESVWISPYHFEDDLREFLENLNLGDKVFVLRSKSLLAGNMTSLIEKVWHMDKLIDSYKGVESVEEYVNILNSDPMIPENLYPMKEIRKSAYKTAYDSVRGRGQ